MSGKRLTPMTARLGRLDGGGQAAGVSGIDDARTVPKKCFASRSEREQCSAPRETTNTGAEELLESGCEVTRESYWSVGPWGLSATASGR